MQTVLTESVIPQHCSCAANRGAAVGEARQVILKTISGGTRIKGKARCLTQVQHGIQRLIITNATVLPEDALTLDFLPHKALTICRPTPAIHLSTLTE